MEIIGIIAVAKNMAIGKDGKLPWHYSEDLRFFKKQTTGNAVLMGYNTWTSIGKPLPKRLNIVVSRKSGLDLVPRVLHLRGKEQALSLAGYLGCSMYIIGGAKTYESFADSIQKWIVTRIPETVADADVFMPEDFLSGFSIAGSESLPGGLVVERYERGAWEKAG